MICIKQESMKGAWVCDVRGMLSETIDRLCVGWASWLETGGSS